jgi:glycogen phosphorylase
MAAPVSTTTPEGVIAYFSMEVALDSRMATYAGGLGILAGDTLRSAADLGMPLVGVSLLHRAGYFRQRLDERGSQREEPVHWRPEEHLEELPYRAVVEVEGRAVHLRAWRYVARGTRGEEVPIYFLDMLLPENEPEDRLITNELYGGDERYRLRQEVVLGMGGIAMLRALGHHQVRAYHLNEGHSALLAVALLRERLAGRPLTDATQEDAAAVRAQCVFTTHTPVPEGHDQFPLRLVERVLGGQVTAMLRSLGCCPDGRLNMTYLALSLSRYINGVAMRHGEVSRGMFPGYPIDSITNGVHAATWATPPFQALFDRHIPRWRDQNSNLRYAVGIPLHEVRDAHEQSKQALLAEVKRRTGRALDAGAMTLGFGRRATPYKRMDLVFSDLERLRGLASTIGPLQIIFAGKAHPRDEAGKSLIRDVFDAARALSDAVPIVYIEDYDMEFARVLCGGSDLWLNTPQRPREASGTSGMKAALNGVPSLSVLDGWWIEGHAEGVTGWSIGETWGPDEDAQWDAEALYDKLERAVLPLYHGNPVAYDRVMRSAIEFNASFFNTERMLRQYASSAYRL